MSSELDTETVKEQVEDLRDCLEDLDDAFAPLKLKEKDTNLTSYLADRNLDPISRAKMLVTMAYSIDSLLFCRNFSSRSISGVADIARSPENDWNQY